MAEVLAEPPPDVSEAAHARVAAWLAARPQLAARLRTAQRVALWVAIPVLVLALLIVPGAARTLPVVAVVIRP